MKIHVDVSCLSLPAIIVRFCSKLLMICARCSDLQVSMSTRRRLRRAKPLQMPLRLRRSLLRERLVNYCYYNRLTASFPGQPGKAGTRKVKPIWILLQQETVSGSGIIWAICKSAPRSRQITMPIPHHSVFYRSDAIPAAQPTASKH